jgi:hypothetical protein
MRERDDETMRRKERKPYKKTKLKLEYSSPFIGEKANGSSLVDAASIE